MGKGKNMKMLLLDIESAPNLAYVWNLWQKGINIDWIETSGYILCFSAKWYGEKKIIFDSIEKSTPKQMLSNIHELLSEADAVITYNGSKFDLPTLNREFVQNEMPPPAPYKHIDLYRVVRRKFKFTSNKLDYICKNLGLGGKVRHRGPQLWLDCMANKESAWKEMSKYNKQDVVILEKLYDRLIPWIKNHPNYALYINTDRPVCPNCGSSKLQKRGKSHTKTQTYTRYQCQDCGKWMRERLSSLSPEEKKNVLVGE